MYQAKTRERILTICDLSQATQGTSKGIGKYLKELRKQAGLKDQSAGNIKDFMRDFGKGM